MLTWEVIERDDLWLLPLEGRSVTRCSPGQDFVLLLDGDEPVEASLSLFQFRDTDGRERPLDAEQDRRLLATALAGLTVAHAYAHKTGRLELEFTDGSRIEADPTPRVESWQVSGPGDVFVVWPAGGDEPAVWDGSNRMALSREDLGGTRE